MAQNDIYNNEKKYNLFVKNYKELIHKPTQPSKRIYYCKNPSNIKYFKKLFDYFDSRDQSYIRRMRLLLSFKIIVYATEKDLKDCDREDINKIITFMHTAYKSPKSKRDFITDMKHLWKVLFPELDEKGRIDETVMPYPIRHLIAKQDKSKDVLRNDRMDIEEFEKIIQSFSQDPRLQCYLTLAWESLGRPQEILYTKIKDVELKDNYAKIWVSSHGKEGTKFLMSIDSYPYLTRWLDKHPLRKNSNAYLFVNLGDNNKYEQLKPTAINKQLRLKLEALDINKTITCYSLKRFGVTYKRYRGDSDVSIQHTAGWTTTKQLHTYDYSQAEETLKIELAKRGLIKEDKYKEYEPKTKKCLFCNHTNAMTDLVCGNCKRPLDRKKIQEEALDKDKKIERLEQDMKEIKEFMLRDVLTRAQAKKLNK